MSGHIRIEMPPGIHADEADFLLDAISDVVYGQFADMGLFMYVDLGGAK